VRFCSTVRHRIGGGGLRGRNRQASLKICQPADCGDGPTRQRGSRAGRRQGGAGGLIVLAPTLLCMAAL